MKRFIVNHCEIKTTLKSLKKLASDTYYRFHSSQRLKHLVLGDDRYPELKVTDDIFSLQIWIKTSEGEEQRIFLDGDVFDLNKADVHTITIEGEQFTEEAFREMNRVLKELSGIGKGFIYAEVQRSPIRYSGGKIQKFPALLSELYNSLSDEKKEEHKVVFEALREGYSPEEY